MNFAWSLKPIFIWLTIWMGLDFDRSKKKKNSRRWLLRIYSVIMFSFYISFSTVKINEHIVNIKYYSNSTDNVGESIFSFWNKTIAWILTHILLIAFYLSVFLSAFLNWKPLWKKIKLVQLNLNYPTTCYRRLRRETFGGLLLLFTVIPNHSLNIVLVCNYI